MRVEQSEWNIYIQSEKSYAIKAPCLGIAHLYGKL